MIKMHTKIEIADIYGAILFIVWRRVCVDVFCICESGGIIGMKRNRYFWITVIQYDFWTEDEGEE